MDHKSLLDGMRAHLTDAVAVMRTDIKDVENKLDKYQERLVKLEGRVDTIRGGINIIVSIFTAIISYFVYKYIDIFKAK